MKKYSVLKIATLSCLTVVMLLLYITKIESIILSVDIPSYFIFISMITICGLLLYSNEDIKDWIEMISKKNNDKRNIPELIYNFCKNHYFKSEAETIDFVKNEIEDKGLANFFVRYIDKNDKYEIQEYIGMQEIAIKKKIENAKKVINFNNVFIIVGVAASYIYDSNIKGILLMAGAMSIYNLMVSKNIESNIESLRQMNELYKNIYEDMLEYKNAKYIMYKCKSILGIDDDYVTIDNIEVETNTKEIVIENNIEKNKTIKVSPDINIESRKSALVTIGKNKNRNNDENSKVVKL